VLATTSACLLLVVATTSHLPSTTSYPLILTRVSSTHNKQHNTYNKKHNTSNMSYNHPSLSLKKLHHLTATSSSLNTQSFSYNALALHLATHQEDPISSSSVSGSTLYTSLVSGGTLYSNNPIANPNTPHTTTAMHSSNIPANREARIHHALSFYQRLTTVLKTSPSSLQDIVNNLIQRTELLLCSYFNEPLNPHANKLHSLGTFLQSFLCRSRTSFSTLLLTTFYLYRFH
jgi:hypothetical protein